MIGFDELFIPAYCYGWEFWAIEEWRKTSWQRYGARLTLSEEFLNLYDEPWKYIYDRFWRAAGRTTEKYPGELTYGPIYLREIAWEKWEIEQGIARPNYRRFEVLHWGRKERIVI